VGIAVFAGRCDEGWRRLRPAFPPPGFESPPSVRAGVRVPGPLVCQLGLSRVEALVPPSRFRVWPPTHLFLL